jgi:D-aspartate ligase
MVTVLIQLGKDQLNTSIPVVVLSPNTHCHCIVRTLGRLGIPMYGVHTNPSSPVARSRYWWKNFTWNLTEASPEKSVDWLLQLGRKIGSRPILIPTCDSSCLFVADNADALREGFRFPNQPDGLACSLSSKKQMYLLCKKHSIPTAETAFPQSRDDVVEFLKSATFPVMLKCIDNTILSRIDMRVVLVKDAETLLDYYDKMEAPDIGNFMLQEYMPGGSELIWMFNGYFDDESRCLFGLTGQKLRQYPTYTGSTSLGICVANDVVAKQTKDFMKALGYRGILDLGYKYDIRTDQYKLFDVNPRIGTAFRLFVDTYGMDVAQVLYRDLTGQPVLSGEPREGRKWIVENFDVASSLTLYRDGKLGFREWIRSFKGVEEASWFAADDLLPFVMMGRHSLRWTFERLFTKEREASSCKLSAER